MPLMLQGPPCVAMWPPDWPAWPTIGAMPTVHVMASNLTGLPSVLDVINVPRWAPPPTWTYRNSPWCLRPQPCVRPWPDRPTGKTGVYALHQCW